jgi:hypothetical protein
LRRFSLLASAAVLATALGLALSDASSAGASDVNYVALGDSFSAGVGSTGDYLNSCEQSAAAYPYLYATANNPSSFSFQACTQATTTDTDNSQLGALGSGTTLVSVTDGGNDIGFSTVIGDCVLGDDSRCLNAIHVAENTMRNQLPGRLDMLYSDIRSDAPHAHVVVLGYPEFYDLSRSDGCSGLDTAKRTAVDQAAGLLDSVISGEAAKYKNFTFVDVRPYFAGHQLCDVDPWLHSLTWPLSDSYHPTAAGQSGAYLPAFEAGI